MDTAPDEDAATATARAQAIVAAARFHPDASFAAGLAASFTGDSPRVKDWLYGNAPDQSPAQGHRALVYRSKFEGQPASQLSVVGEAKVMNAVVPSYVLGSVLATTKAHPFAAMGAAVSSLTFDEQTTRRRFAIRSCAPAFQRVEVAALADGGLITHERCIVRCVTTGEAVSCLHHEVITWHHRTVCVPGEMPATETAAARLVQRCSPRRQPCRECAPSGVPVLQPCPHVVARVRGVTFSRGWDDYVDLLIDTPVGGTAHFELQQPATAAAAMANPPAEPAETRAATDSDAMVLSAGSPVVPPGSSTNAATAAAGSSVTQTELDAGSAELPPVSYQCDHFSLENPERFFNTTLREALALEEAYPFAAGHAQGRPADTPVTAAIAKPTAGRAGSEQRRPPPPIGTGGWEPGVASSSQRPGLAIGFPAVAEPAQVAPSIGATVTGSLYPAAGPHTVSGTDDAAAVAGMGRDFGTASAAAAAAPTMDWLQREPEERFGGAQQQMGPDSSAMEQPLEPTLFPVDTPLFSQATAPPFFDTTTPQGTAPPMQGTEPLMKGAAPPIQDTAPPMQGITPPMLPLPSMPSSTYPPWLTTGQRPLDTVLPPPAAGAASSAAPSQSAIHHPFHDPPRDPGSSPPRPRSRMCELCGSSFSSASDLSRHTSTVHDRIRRWKCPECDFVALQRGHLTTHAASVHATERRFVCDKCEPGPTAFRGVTRSAVQRHTRRVHEGKRPYACKECDTRFASSSDLTRHRRRLHGAIISTRAETLRAREEAMAAAKAMREATTTAEESGVGSASPAVGGQAAASMTSGDLSESNPSMSAGLSSSTEPRYASYGAATASESAPSDAVSTRLAAAAASTSGVPGSGMEPAIWNPNAEPLHDDRGAWPPPPNLPYTHPEVLMPATTAAPSAAAGPTPLRDSADQVSDWQRHHHGALSHGRSYEGEQAAQATVPMGMGGTVPRLPALDSYPEVLETDAPADGSPALGAAGVVLPAPPPSRAASEGGAPPEAETERHDTERRDSERRLRCLPVRRLPREQAHPPLSDGGGGSGRGSGGGLSFLHGAPAPRASMTAAALLLPFNSPSATTWLFPRARPLSVSPLRTRPGSHTGGRMQRLAPALRGPLHLLSGGGVSAAGGLLAHPLSLLLATARRRLALAAAATALTIVRVRRVGMRAQATAGGGGLNGGSSAAAAAGEPLGALSMALLEPMTTPRLPPSSACRGDDGRGVAVLIIADRSSASAATAWGTRLVSAVATPPPAVPRIAVAAVIDVSSLPAMAASVVRQYLSALTDVHVLDSPGSGRGGGGKAARRAGGALPPPSTRAGVAVLDSAGAARGEMGFVPGRVRLVVVDLGRGRILRAQDVGPQVAGNADDEVLRRVLDVAYAAAVVQP